MRATKKPILRLWVNQTSHGGGREIDTIVETEVRLVGGDFKKRSRRMTRFRDGYYMVRRHRDTRFRPCHVRVGEHVSQGGKWSSATVRVNRSVVALTKDARLLNLYDGDKLRPMNRAEYLRYRARLKREKLRLERRWVSPGGIIIRCDGHEDVIQEQINAVRRALRGTHLRPGPGYDGGE